jgi:hypothetical protein
MRAWIVAGIAGWLAGLLPLVGVNVANYEGLLGYQQSALAGAVALFGGTLLGGLVAGWLGGRQGRGIAGAWPAGGSAALLYAVTIIGVRLVAGFVNSASPLLTENLAALFCAALLLAIALAVGMLVDRGGRGATSSLPLGEQRAFAPPRSPNLPRPAAPPPPSRPAHSRAPYPSTPSGAGRFGAPPADPDADALYAASRREAPRSLPAQRGRGPSGRRDGGRSRTTR